METAGVLFSGLGLTSQGAEQAGLEVVFSANHWDLACEYHDRNHRHPSIQQDLAEMDWTHAPAVDVVLATPACQGHTQVGQPARKGKGGSHQPDAAKLAAKHQRDRNTAWAVLACADTVRPERIMVENVPDFMDWEAYGAWCSVLEAFGYQVRSHVLNALDYGGAQDRPRAIVTAGLGKAIELAPKWGPAPRTIAECLDPDDHPDNRWQDLGRLTKRMRPLVEKAINQAGQRCFWNNVSDSRGRPLDDHFPTATTQSGTQWNLIDAANGRRRVLNPREMARSMSAPESYVIPKKRGEASELIGNAMDCNLAEGISAQLVEA